MADPNILILRDFQSFLNEKHTHASLKIIDIAMVLQMRSDRCILGFTYTCDINNDKNNREGHTPITVLICGMLRADCHVLFHMIAKRTASYVIYVTYEIIN